MKAVHTIAILLAFAFVTSHSSAEPTRLLRQPALSATQLAFVYAGDLWIADRDGGNPRRLTTHPADEYSPFFSPDGNWIAFAATYENNTDVFVISVNGGQPRRLTWHPGSDIPVGWTPDGRFVAFASARETDHGRSGQLYHVSVEGGAPVKQMEARFYRGTYDPTGRYLAYIAHGAGYNGLFGGTSGWRGYRGGTTPSINVMDLREKAVYTIPGDRVTDFNAFWLEGQLYFLSDRENKILSLYRFDPQSRALTRIAGESTWDIRSAAGHGDTVVYEAGGQLKRLNLASGDVALLDITLNPDLPQRQMAWKDVSSTIQAAGISPNGKRALLTARGDVLTVPVEDGSTRNLTGTDGVREYSAIWSPDGGRVAWIVESLEGQKLVISDQTGMGDRESFELGPHFYQLQAWDPTGSRMAYTDNRLGLFVISLTDGRSTKIAEGARRDSIDVAFSPDGRWLAYTQKRANYYNDLMVHSFDNGRSSRVSDGMADVRSPVFSRDGRLLFFAASTNSGPIQFGLDMTSQERPYRAGLYAAVLTSDGVSPLAPKPGDETIAKEDAEDREDREKEEEKKDANSPPPTRIDFDGLIERTVGLPVAEGNYRMLQVAKDGTLYYLHAVQPGATMEPPGQTVQRENRLKRFDFEKREESTVFNGLQQFIISQGGEHMLIRRADGSLAVAKIESELKPEALKLGDLRMHIDPRKEWAQIFDEAWRMQKEFFYATNLHGIDWQAVYTQYRPLVEHLGRREDLNALIVEMIAELQAGHNRVGGGDMHQETAVKVGLLGANFTVQEGRYRFARIYTGEAWNPFLRGPLATPGNQAREGEYLLAVNGRELTSEESLFARFQHTVGKQVTLRVGPNPDGSDARDIVVEPVESENDLRLWAWVEANRRDVETATDGRVGYIYLPNTAGAGYTFFNRMFYAQLDKQALVIDERSNGGGQAANYITEVLSRRHLSTWKDFTGLLNQTPMGALYGPKVMLIDQDAGSGGDYLPYSFRTLGIGKLIGTRTWGGLIGIFANPPLVDGGILTVPFFRFIDVDGNWSIENEGVAPDIHVQLDPIATNAGRDTQLEAAIAEILKQLETFESPVPPEPPLPTKLGR